ncbi:MAG: adenine deaminase C-terminal domain-containing protein [Xanthobacteraceae bacterium]
MAAPDLLIRGPSVWNPFTGEIQAGDIAICASRIAKVGPWSGPLAAATAVIAAEGRIAVPGYIEPHTHPWPFANPLSLGEVAVCRGTTCLVYDDLLLHLALGVERLRAVTAALSAAALPRILWVARIASQSRFEAEQTVFAPAVIARLLQEPQYVGTAEMTRWSDLLVPERSAPLLTVLENCRRAGKFNEGHTAGASPRRLSALANAGIRSCHEAINAEEALERLRRGFWTILRHSSLRQDLPSLIACLKATSFHDRLAYTTDGTAETHVQDHGLTDHLIRIALESGVPPNVAYRMATLNPATYLGLDEDLGAVAPGRVADVNILGALDEPTPQLVICRGRVVARDGALVVPAPSETFAWNEHYAGATPLIPEWEREVFLLPGNAPNPFPAGRLVEAAITRETPVELAPQGPGLWPRDDDCLVVAVTDRGGEWITRGVVRNIGDKLAAVATTYASNAGVLVLGRSPDAMAEALRRLRRLGGGIALCSSAGDWCEFAMPMAGIHRAGGFADAARTARDFQRAFAACGYPHSDAKYSLFFLTADMLPEVRATEAGWVRIKTGEVLFPSEAVRRTFKADHELDTLRNSIA